MDESRTDQQSFQEQAAVFARRRTAHYHRRLLEKIMEAERDQFLQCDPYQRCGRRQGYRNGYRVRYLQTAHGSLRIRVPRVRDSQEPFRPRTIAAYQRRSGRLDEIVTEWLACGMSTRSVSRVLEQTFGVLLSPGTVSRVVAELDQEIRAFRSRPLDKGFRYLYLDAKHTHICHRRRRRGRGKKKDAVVLLCWGVRYDGSEELVEFRVADSESEKCWSDFITSLWQRGLRRRDRWGRPLQMIATDGDAGLRGALLTVYPTVPRQRCAFHKVQSLAEHVSVRSRRKALLASAAAIYRDLKSPPQAHRRLALWAQRWGRQEPQAVESFRYEFEDTLTYLRAPAAHQSRLKTTNPIERFIEELNRKIQQVGIFPSARSLERTLYLVWRKLQRQGYGRVRPHKPPTLFTPNS